ncbi:MAG: hypothetical protein EOO03_08680 [Chitinophagaceae bacterium]|nr:MAG: hypothetical protein EOO03_08680 [Chitinophagaceae bacterium]
MLQPTSLKLKKGLIFFLLGFALFTNSCKKTDFPEVKHLKSAAGDVESFVTTSTADVDITNWLGSKQAEFGEAGSILIERMLPLLRMDEKYDEPYGYDGQENFIVVPIDYSSALSEHIRTDLAEPFQYLLIVADANGQIRRVI